MKWVQVLLLFFAVHAHATPYQFQGTYYDYTGPNTCRRVPAIATVDITDSGSVLSIQAPGAVCPVPTFTEGNLPYRSSILADYSMRFNGQSDCAYYKRGPVFVDFAMSGQQIIQPVIYSKQGHWHQTIFEVGQHTAFKLCN